MSEIDNGQQLPSEASVAAPTPRSRRDQLAGQRRLGPRYEQATLGFKNYWYPVCFSKKLHKGKRKAVKLLGEELVIYRDPGSGDAHAFVDRCPHRGTPLSVFGQQDFPGTITCGYHGWVFNLESGECVAALTDGPNAPVCKRRESQLRRYPTFERSGLVWVWMGDQEPVAPEMDIPDDIFDGRHTVVGFAKIRKGDWRMAAENGFDEGHYKYLHRSSKWTLFKNFPAWTSVRVKPHPKDGDKGWIYPLQGHFGEADDVIDLGDVRRLEAALRSSGQPVDVHTYPGAGHAFHDDTHPHYHRDAAELSWQRTVQFLEAHL